ncbi:MAG: hypothetical protein ACQEQL_00770 [Pseudomonadota bacterium]
MRLRSLFTSSIFHIAVIVVLTVGISFSSDREITQPPPMVVEFAEVAEKSETPTPAAKPPTPKKQETAPEPKRQDDKPKPAPTNTSNAPVAPVEKPPEKKPEPAPPAPKVRPKSIAKPDAPPKPEPEESNKKASEKQEEPEEKEEPDKDPVPQRDFSSVLKNLAENEEKPEDAEKADEDAATTGQQAPMGSQLTVNELDALRRQLEGCWNLPIGAREVDEMVIDVNLIVNRDRTIREAKIVDTARYSRDSFFRAVADSALRAVRSPNCSPLQLPEDKYDMWQNIIVEFNPKEMF